MLAKHLIASIVIVWLLSLSVCLPVLSAGPGFSLSKRDNVVVVEVSGQPFAEYVLNDPATNKTYLWPVFGPTGTAMTRAYPMKDVEGEVKDHYHHRGICFGHEDIGGFDTWAELGSFDKGEKTSEANKQRIEKLGKQVHRSIQRMEANADQATLVTSLDYVAPDGKVSFSELRTLVFQVDGNLRLIDFDQVFTSMAGDVMFTDKKDAGLSIRVPTSMSVDSKLGGKIVNSEGEMDANAWGKRAKWCDYFGPVGKEKLGVAILNHPTSFRHPTTWHVRTYGLFTANPFGTLDPKFPNGPHTLRKGEKLTLRHRFVLHQGDSDSAKIKDAYETYAKLK